MSSRAHTAPVTAHFTLDNVPGIIIGPFYTLINTAAAIYGSQALICFLVLHLCGLWSSSGPQMWANRLFPCILSDSAKSSYFSVAPFTFPPSRRCSVALSFWLHVISAKNNANAHGYLCINYFLWTTRYGQNIQYTLYIYPIMHSFMQNPNNTLYII